MSTIRVIIVIASAFCLLGFLGCSEAERLDECKLKNAELQNTIDVQANTLKKKEFERIANDEGLKNLLGQYAEAYDVFEKRVAELEKENLELKDSIPKTSE